MYEKPPVGEKVVDMEKIKMVLCKVKIWIGYQIFGYPIYKELQGIEEERKRGRE